MERRHQLKEWHHLLNTEAGKTMMDELGMQWDRLNPLDENAQTMGFNIGLQQAYRQLKAWQDGEGLRDE